MKKLVPFLVMICLFLALNGCRQTAGNNEVVQEYLPANTTQDNEIDGSIENLPDEPFEETKAAQETEAIAGNDENDNEGEYTYMNEKEGYLLKFPLEWKDKIEIREGDTYTTVWYVNGASENEGQLFSIIFKDAKQTDLPYPSYKKLDVKNNQLYIGLKPTDFPYIPGEDPEEVIEKYSDMLKQVDQILETFSFIEE